MTILEELNTLLSPLNIPIETGVFTGAVPQEYLVITPLTDDYTLHSDNRPHVVIEESRISVFTVGSYTLFKRLLTRELLGADFTITDSRYLGFDTETGYHGYAIDVQKNYILED